MRWREGPGGEWRKWAKIQRVVARHQRIVGTTMALATWHATPAMKTRPEAPCPLGMNYVLLPLVLLTAYSRHVVSFAKHLVFMICDRAQTYGSSYRQRSHTFV
jgi:hypothetical protein